MYNEGKKPKVYVYYIQYAIGQAATTYPCGSVEQLPQDPDGTALNLPRLGLLDRIV